jgi:two-component system, NarL family, sensor kinase
VLIAGTRAAVAAATVLAVAAAVVGLRYRPGPLAVTFAVLAVGFLSVPVVGAAAARAAPANPVGWMLLASGVLLPVAMANPVGWMLLASGVLLPVAMGGYL